MERLYNGNNKIALRINTMSDSAMNTNRETKIIIKPYLWMLFLISFAVFLSQISSKVGGTPVNIAAAAIIVGYCMFCGEEKIFYVAVFLMSSNRMFTFVGISVNLIVIMIFYLREVLFKKVKLKFNFAFLTFVLLAYSLLDIWAYDDTNGIMTIIKTFIILMFCIYVFIENKDIYKPHVVIYATFFMCLGLIINATISIAISPDSIMAGYKFSMSDNSNRNALAIICVSALSNLVILWKNKYVQLDRYWPVMALLITIVGIFTQSRTFMLGLGIVIIWLLVPSKGMNINKNIKYYLMLVFFILLGYFIITSSDIISNIFNNAWNRIVAPKNDDILNGRATNWNNYMAVLRENNYVLLFGAGTYTNVGLSAMAHNMWLEILVSYGVVGTIIIVLYYFTAIRILVSKIKTKFSFSGFYNFLPFIMVFACGWTSHTFMSINNTLQIFLSITLLYLTPNENIEKQYYKLKDFSQPPPTEDSNLQI